MRIFRERLAELVREERPELDPKNTAEHIATCLENFTQVLDKEELGVFGTIW